VKIVTPWPASAGSLAISRHIRNARWRRRPWLRAFRLAIGWFAILLVTTSCGDLTRVSAPNTLQPSDLQNPTGAVAQAAGAVSLFATAFAEQALYSGLISDELTDRSQGAFPADTRVINVANQGAGYPYADLSNARINSLIAIGGLERYSPSPASRIGELFAYVADVDIMFAENMCSGVPTGTIKGGTPVYGPVLARNALLAEALRYLDSARARADSADSVLNLVRVSRGRALLDSGDYAGAATAVDSVPTGFTYQPPYNASVFQANVLYVNNVQYMQVSVSDREGGNGLNFVSAGDPRVPTQDLGPGQSGGDVVAFMGYSNASAPLSLASGIEARLIESEVQLHNGAISGWATALNALRQSAIAPPLDTLSSDSTTAADVGHRLAVQFRERAFWLFASGHRQGDMRRLVRYYAQPVESVFPTGLYEGGPNRYGSDVTFIPLGENFNSAFRGCIDRNP
jgi:hypothetical protein